MTQAQEQAITRILEIAREHFEASLIVVETENDDNTDTRETIYHGGVSRAIGLAVLAQDRLRQQNQVVQDE